MSQDLIEMAAIASLNDMMAKPFFSIVTVDKIATMLGVNPSLHPSYRILSTLHCVNWDRMPRELRDAVPGMIKECLGVEATYQFRSDVVEFTAPRRTGFLKLLSR